MWIGDTEKTWYISTSTGETSLDNNSHMGGDVTEIGAKWTERFGANHMLSDGDRVSLVYKDNHTLSVVMNEVEMDGVFHGLPRVPLWLVIRMDVKKLAIG